MKPSRTLAPAGDRVAIGLVLQPFVAALLGFSLFPVVEYSGRSLYRGRSVDLLDGAIRFGLSTGIAGLLVVVLGACPVLLWLMKRGPVTRRQVLISGGVLGNLPSAVIVVALAASRLRQGATPDLDNLTYGPLGALRAILIGSFIGVASAGVFWWLASGDTDGDTT